MPGPISNPSLPLAVCIENADEGQHPRTFPTRARGCRFNGQFRGAHIRPRREGLLQPTLVDCAWRRIVGRGHSRLQLFGNLIKAKQRGQREASQITIVLYGAANDISFARRRFSAPALPGR